MRNGILTLVLSFLQVSCSDIGTGPPGRYLDLSLRYGVLARNELNTFNDRFTKDLILDGTATTTLVLSPADFDSIEPHLRAIDILEYADTFVVLTRDTIVSINPYQTYILKVRMGSRWKEVFWEDSIISADPRATQLREAVEFIRALVQSKPEYKQLPPARGGYG